MVLQMNDRANTLHQLPFNSCQLADKEFKIPLFSNSMKYINNISLILRKIPGSISRTVPSDTINPYSIDVAKIGMNFLAEKDMASVISGLPTLESYAIFVMTTPANTVISRLSRAKIVNSPVDNIPVNVWISSGSSPG